MEVSSQMIQDPNLVGIIICSENPIFVKEEVCSLFQQCELPIIQIFDAEAFKKFQMRKEEFLPFSQLSEELSEYTEKGFKSIAKDLSKILNTPLLYLNDHYQVIWETGKEEQLRLARRWINVHQRKWNSLDHLDTSVLSNPSRTVLKDSYKPYSVQVPGLTNHWLLVSSNLVPWQRRVIDKFIGLTTLYLQSETHLKQLHEKFISHFVYDLLYHKFESYKTLIEQGKLWGWNLEKPHHLLLINADYSEEWNREGGLINEIIYYLENEKSKQREIFHVFLFDDQIVLLLEDEVDRTREERKKHVVQLAQELERKLSRQWGKDHFQIGIGKWYQETTNLNKSYQEAKLALQFGRGWYKDQNVFHYNDLGVLRLLMYVHQGILADFSNEYLSELIESDCNNGTEYIKTLLTFIQYRGKIDEVSDALFIHPNTLRYRMKKIEEILGIDFQDPEEFSNVMIAVRINSFLDS